MKQQLIILFGSLVAVAVIITAALLVEPIVPKGNYSNAAEILAR